AIEKYLRLSPVMPVVTLQDAALGPDLARALLRGGIRVIEVTLRTPVALRAMEVIAREVPEITVGAGTVLSQSDLKAAASTGAPASRRHGPDPLSPGCRHGFRVDDRTRRRISLLQVLSGRRRGRSRNAQ